MSSRGGRGGRKGGRGNQSQGKSPNLVPVPRPTLIKRERLDDHLTRASNPQLPHDERIDALHNVSRLLNTEAGRDYAMHQFNAIWPQAVGLLWSDDDSLCVAAGPIVGSLGSIAASSPQTVARGVLFDWLLPVLTSKHAHGQQKTLTSVQLESVLVAVRDCTSTFTDQSVLSRYATNILDACKALLEDTALSSVNIVICVMQLLVDTAQYKAAMYTRFTTLVDLLINWCMKESFNAEARAQLGKTLTDLAVFWAQQDYGAQLLDRQFVQILSSRKKCLQTPNDSYNTILGRVTIVVALFQVLTDLETENALEEIADAVEVLHRNLPADGSSTQEACLLVVKLIKVLKVYEDKVEEEEDEDGEWSNDGFREAAIARAHAAVGAFVLNAILTSDASSLPFTLKVLDKMSSPGGITADYGVLSRVMDVLMQYIIITPNKQEEDGASKMMAVAYDAMVSLFTAAGSSLGVDLFKHDGSKGFTLLVSAIGDLSDASSEVRKAAQKLLCCISLPATASLVYTTGQLHHCSDSDDDINSSSLLMLSSAAVTAALNEQPHLCFKAPELERFLQYLTGINLSSLDSTASGSNTKKPSEKKDGAPMEAWLPKLLQKLAASNGVTIPVPSTAWTAWLAVHQAVHSTLSCRLKTQYGGPSQTFAALETALKDFISRSKAETLTFSQWQRGRLLIDYLFALEQGILACANGSLSRSEGSKATVVFFAGNLKVCLEWFKRIRPLNLEAAAGLDHSHLTVFHGLRLLEELRQRYTSAAAIKAAAAKQEEEEDKQEAAVVSESTTANENSSSRKRGKKQQKKLKPLTELQPTSFKILSKPVTALDLSKQKGTTPSILVRPAAALLDATRTTTTAAVRQPTAILTASTALNTTTPSKKELSKKANSGDEAGIIDAALSASAFVGAALCTLKDSLALQGLVAFCEKSFGSGDDGNQWVFLKALLLQAQGQYHAAVEKYKECDQEKIPREAVRCITDTVAEAYIAVSDFESFNQWIVLSKDGIQGQQSSIVSSSNNYKSLAEWGQGDVSAALDLVNPPNNAPKPAPSHASIFTAALEAASLPVTNRKQIHGTVEKKIQSKIQLVVDMMRAASVTGGLSDGLHHGLVLKGLRQLAGVQLLLQENYGGGYKREFLRHQPKREFTAWSSSSTTQQQASNIEPAMELLTWGRSLPVFCDRGNLDLLVSEALYKSERHDLVAANYPTLTIYSMLVRSDGSINQDYLKGLIKNEDKSINDAAIAEYIARFKAELDVDTVQSLLDGGASDNAALWWQLAQLGSSDRKTVVLACCKALTLSSSSTNAETLPILLKLLNTLFDGTNGSKEQEDEDAEVAAAIACIPSTVFLPVLNQIIAQLHPCIAQSNPWASKQAQRILVQVALMHPVAVLTPLLATSNTSTNNSTNEIISSGMIGPMRALHPVLVTQLDTLITGLSKIAVLVDDHWLNILTKAQVLLEQRLYDATQQLLKSYNAEDGALNEQDEELLQEAIQQVYLVAAAPVVIPLTRHLDELDALEQSGNGSPHEKEFYKELGSKIYAVVVKSLTPPLQLSSPSSHKERADSTSATSGSGGKKQQRRRKKKADDVVSDESGNSPLSIITAAFSKPIKALKDLIASLNNFMQPSPSLKLSAISPLLSSSILSGTDALLPIPGANSTTTGVYIESINPTVLSLNTKTRPKRVVLVGSDGRQYHYLVKGREDLRVDQRLMQVSSAMNAAIRASSSDSSGVHPQYQTLFVMPLDARTGLIRWVEDSVPIYQVVKQWQVNRAERVTLLKAAAAAQQQGGGGGTSRQAAAVKQQQQQPVATMNRRDAFYVALKAVGIDINDTKNLPRDQWPIEKLRQVLKQLMRSTPNNLLASEVWYGSAGPAHWWKRQRNYTASVSASSMIGYLLGVGDRHLDNILLDQKSGSVVHIDYAVVFDKGLKLQVPELVPFRLTPNIVTALGSTGIEGPFRELSQQVLTAARSNASVLQDLLSSVLRDPWVDWNWETELKEAKDTYICAVELGILVSEKDKAPSLGIQSAVDTVCRMRDLVINSSEPIGEYLALFTTAEVSCTSMLEAREAIKVNQAIVDESEGVFLTLHARLDKGRQEVVELERRQQRVQAEAESCLKDCMSWYQQQEALVSGLLTAYPPPELTISASCIDPVRATTIWLAEAPAVASIYSLLPDTAVHANGMGTVLRTALGLAPEDAPLSPNVLLQASAIDETGLEFLQERARAVEKGMDCLQQYVAALHYILGPEYASTTVYSKWIGLLEQAASGTRVSNEEVNQLLAPVDDSEHHKASTKQQCRLLETVITAGNALLDQFSATQSGLQAAYSDVSCSAAECKQRLVTLLSQPGLGVKEAAESFAEYLLKQSEVLNGFMNADNSQSAIVDQLQRFVLGLATTILTLRDSLCRATTDSSAEVQDLFFAITDDEQQQSSILLLDWLHHAVQTVDSLSTAATELQLSSPSLVVLVSDSSSEEYALVNSRIEKIDQQLLSLAGDTIDTTVSVLEDVLTLARLNNTMCLVLQSLQSVYNACDTLCSSDDDDETDSQSVNQLAVARAAVELWKTLTATNSNSSWESVSSALSSAVSFIVTHRGLVDAMQSALVDSSQALGQRLLSCDADLLMSTLLVSQINNQEQQLVKELVPFTDFETTNTADNSDALEGALEDGVDQPPSPTLPVEEEEEWEQLADEFEATVAITDDELESTVTLVDALLECSDASGSLAAVDAVQYLTSAAVQQYQPQHAQHEATYASLVWFSNCLDSQKTTTSTLLRVRVGHEGALQLSPAMTAVPPSPIAEWSLQCHRQELLQQMQECMATLQSSQEAISQWEMQAAGVEGLLMQQLGNAIPHAQQSLQSAFNERRQWLGDATSHAERLGSLLATVLDFESSRSSSDGNEKNTAANRYKSAVVSVAEVAQALEKAQDRVLKNETKLQETIKRREESSLILEAAQAKLNASEASFIPLAMPLVKATQKLATTLVQYNNTLFNHHGIEQSLGILKAVDEYMMRVSNACRKGSHVAHIKEAVMKEYISDIQPSVKSAEALYTALHGGFLPALGVVRQQLVQGERGEAAARSQAVDIVTGLGASILGVIKASSNDDDGLQSLDKVYTSVAESVAAGVSLMSSRDVQPAVNALLTHSTRSSSRRRDGSASELHMSPGYTFDANLFPSGSTSSEGVDDVEKQMEQYAASTLSKFTKKLHGVYIHSASSGPQYQAMDVDQQVTRLIAQATSVDTLARMYEGWTAWI